VNRFLYAVGNKEILLDANQATKVKIEAELSSFIFELNKHFPDGTIPAEILSVLEKPNSINLQKALRYLDHTFLSDNNIHMYRYIRTNIMQLTFKEISYFSTFKEMDPKPYMDIYRDFYTPENDPGRIEAYEVYYEPYNRHLDRYFLKDQAKSLTDIFLHQYAEYFNVLHKKDYALLRAMAISLEELENILLDGFRWSLVDKSVWETYQIGGICVATEGFGTHYEDGLGVNRAMEYLFQKQWKQSHSNYPKLPVIIRFARLPEAAAFGYGLKQNTWKESYIYRHNEFIGPPDNFVFVEPERLPFFGLFRNKSYEVIHSSDVGPEVIRQIYIFNPFTKKFVKFFPEDL
jgi:hypothetical protein